MPFSVNFMALFTRFLSICGSLYGSDIISRGLYKCSSLTLIDTRSLD